MIRVAIADDDPLARAAISLLFSQSKNLEIVFKASNGREAIEYVQQHEPDVLVMDIRMPELDGLATTKQIKESPVATRIILMSGRNDRSYVQLAADVGADGFIPKNRFCKMLLPAIDRVYRGECLLKKDEKY